MEEAKRKLLGPIEIGALIIGLGIIAYLGYKNGGVVTRSENIVVHEKPREIQGKPSPYKGESKDESVETMLNELADHFSDTSQRSKKSAKKTTKATKKISRDEAKFYDKVKKKESLSDKVKSTADWLRVLRTSQKTYSKVRSILSETARKSPNSVNSDNISQNLKSDSSEQAFFQNLSKSFGISEKDIKAFSNSGKNAISDWAEYIQENQKKD